MTDQSSKFMNFPIFILVSLFALNILSLLNFAVVGSFTYNLINYIYLIPSIVLGIVVGRLTKEYRMMNKPLKVFLWIHLGISLTIFIFSYLMTPGIASGSERFFYALFQGLVAPKVILAFLINPPPTIQAINVPLNPTA